MLSSHRSSNSPVNVGNDDTRSSVTVADSSYNPEARHPRSSSNASPENVHDDASTEKRSANDAPPSRPNSSSTTLSTHTAAPETPVPDPNLVTWDGPDDPENPKTWPARRRWVITIANSLITLCVYVPATSFVDLLLTRYVLRVGRSGLQHRRLPSGIFL